jgi:alcohol dehydrogenase YqhD (iron-dependent ADH family)
MSISEADEQKVREWLRHLMEPGATSKAAASHAATILALLDRPVMPRPEEVPAEVLDRMEVAYWDTQPGSGFDDVRAAIKVLREWATKREPVKVEAWAIATPSGEIVATYRTEEAARKRAMQCVPDVRVTRIVEADHD